MRDIKFRGRSTSTYRNVFGSLCVFNTFNGGKVYSIKEDDDNFEPVYEETIGQYTGLKDKNGVDIYEGDIVASKYKYKIIDKGVVAFDCGVFGIEWECNMKRKNMLGVFGQRHNLRRMDDDIIDNIEVIGNIYDNSELLEWEEE